MATWIKTTLNPAMYHGHGMRPPFFEGWYFKLVSADETRRMAIIPGIILGDKGHAFIQVLDGASGHSSYHVFPIDAFWASQENFEVRIGKNRFTTQQVNLDVDDELGRISGELHFEGVSPWPVSLISPGIMGWYAWAPRMECYHGVLSFDHAIQGELQVNGAGLDFNRGRGYIEKDWGQSFPAGWVWFQSNHFDQPETCLTASVAIIPWLGSAFRGFIIGLWRQGKLVRFATYSGAKIEKLSISGQQVEWVVRNRRFRLEMLVRQAPSGQLLGPTRVEMGKRVDETLDASVEVRLSRLSGEILFEGSARYAGLEVEGELEKLLNF
jgi:tocopherol cyclase